MSFDLEQPHLARRDTCRRVISTGSRAPHHQGRAQRPQNVCDLRPQGLAYICYGNTCEKKHVTKVTHGPSQGAGSQRPPNIYCYDLLDVRTRYEKRTASDFAR